MGMAEILPAGFRYYNSSGRKTKPSHKKKKPWLQPWPVSRRVNSSKADADDGTLIDKVELAAA
jgi:hypothetical protein